MDKLKEKLIKFSYSDYLELEDIKNKKNEKKFNSESIESLIRQAIHDFIIAEKIKEEVHNEG